MPHNEFLRLLQTVEANRRCEGKDCIGITDAHVANADEIEANRLHHLLSADSGLHPRDTCEGCSEIQGKVIALRETLHSEGIDFPVGLLEG